MAALYFGDHLVILREHMSNLFRTMQTGGLYGNDDIAYFNGGLFDDDQALMLGAGDLQILAEADRLDWGSIEPAIFGTLFERGLDPAKRSQLGAHYTSRSDILLIVEPVLMAPFRRRWETIRVALEADERTEDGGALLASLLDDLAAVQVLDPACGSGNFLYVALRQLLDLEKEVGLFATQHGVAWEVPRVSPAQLHGIEINVYAHELASIVIWIGYLQWLHDNGFEIRTDPVLKPLEAIQQLDAILAYDDQGKPVEPEWPAVDVILGNPPFLGDKKMRAELGDAYVDNLRHFYAGRVPGGADLVCYWFEKARAQIEAGRAKRAGLLATSSIRGGSNRAVLDRIKQTGDIFMAWGDLPWMLDGAAVRTSMVGFDDAKDQSRYLNGSAVLSIAADLTASVDLTKAKRLMENSGVAYIGDSKKGKFDIKDNLAAEMIGAAGNPNGRSNRDVLVPWANGIDVADRPQGMWIIDFGLDMPEYEAAQFEQPFEHVRQYVKPDRDAVRNRAERMRWWLHARPAPDMRTALKRGSRYIATSNVSKHRTFVWFSNDVLPSHSLTVIARDDDYFFGVLHSRLHELWALRLGTSLEDRPRYTPTTTFETFPFPWPPGEELADDPRVDAIAQAARELVQMRDAWLNPPDATEADLKKRTLTNLYNQRPTWLNLAHQKLDQAVLAAYGWPADLADEAILERLLALNLSTHTRMMGDYARPTA